MNETNRSTQETTAVNRDTYFECMRVLIKVLRQLGLSEESIRPIIDLQAE